MDSGNTHLLIRFDTLSSGNYSKNSGILSFPSNSVNGDSIQGIYRIGLVLSSGDTLWGNRAPIEFRLNTPWTGYYAAMYAGKSFQRNVPNQSTLIAGKAVNIYSDSLNSQYGVPWADSSEETFSTNGMVFKSDSAYFSAKNTFHIVANILPKKNNPSGKTTLMAVGFEPKYSATLQSYPWLRLSYQNNKLFLESFDQCQKSGASNIVNCSSPTVSDSVALDSAILYSGSWEVIHMMFQPYGSNGMQTHVYFGNSSIDSLTPTITMQNPNNFKWNIADSVVVVEIPGQAQTDLDNFLANSAGNGSNLVGDFAMISQNGLTRKSVVTSYISPWAHTGAGALDSANYVSTTNFPVITQILYAAPGDHSTSSFTSTKTYQTAITFNSSTSLGYSIGWGVDIPPEVWDAECGVNISNTFSQSLTVGTNTSFTTSSMNSISGTTTQADGDYLLLKNISVQSHLLERPRLRYLFGSNVMPSQKCYFVASKPLTMSQTSNWTSVKSFLQDTTISQSAKNNFWKLYAKDSTGMVRQNLIQTGMLDSINEIVFHGSESGGTGLTLVKDSSITFSQTESVNLNTSDAFSATLTAGGFTLSGGLNLSITVEGDYATTATTDFSTSATLQDIDNWDQFDVKVYMDKRWGVPVYQLNSVNSFTSFPQEPFSQKATNVVSVVTDLPDTVYVGDTVTVNINVKNNSNQLNAYLNSNPIYINIAPDSNFYSTNSLISITPNSIQLLNNSSQNIQIKYLATKASASAAGFVVSDGFDAGVMLESAEVTAHSIVADPPEGIDQIKANLNVIAIPNGLRLMNSKNGDKIIDARGTIVYQVSKSSSQIDVNLEPGIYIVKSSNQIVNRIVW